MGARRRWKNWFLKAVVILGGGAVVAGAVALVVYVLVRGFAALSLDMLLNEPSLMFGTVGVMPAIANTLLMMVSVTFIAMPFGLLASMLLNYIKKPWLKFAMLYITEVAAELPPVVYGLLGMLVFCQWFGMGVSVMAGCFTMGAMLAMDVMSSAENYHRLGNWRLRRQATALGASPGQLIYTISLPESMPLTVAGFLRALARVASETMSLLLTMGAGAQLAESMQSAFHQSGSTLSVMLYIYVQQRGDFNTGFAIAALLLVLVGVLIVGSNICAACLGKRRGG